MNSSIKFSIICALALLLFSCSKKDAPDKPIETTALDKNITTVELTQDQYTMAGIELGSIEMKQLSSVLKVNGMLDSPPQNVVSVSPRIGGYIRSTPLLQGLRVRKGQTIAVLEHQDIIMLEQEFLETRSRLEFAEAEFKRQETLQKDNINAVKTFQQSLADYKSLQARNSALRQRLALIGIRGDNLREGSVGATYTILSPMNGYVTDVNVTLGQFVAPSDVMCRIINPEHVHAELSVFERDAPKLREGQRVRVTLVNETEERGAKVYLIGREITTSRTVRVHAHLDKEDGKLLPNTALKALVELGSSSVPAVPEAAVVSADGKEYIFIVAEEEHHEGSGGNNKHIVFTMVEVRRGETAGGYTEVFLPENIDRKTSKIVVKGAYALLSERNASEGGDEHGH
jgi:membrane fusion protein, heavy metal efflux system